MNILVPICFTIFAWWASTAAILWLINRPVSTHVTIGRGFTALLVLATIGIVMLRQETGVAAAYWGFFLGVISWGWHEVMLLLGFVSGPRKTPCPPDLPFGQRFRASAQAILHHEAGIVVHAGLLALLSIGASNMAAALTFYVLWAMRISAKLLVFFGAPNVAEHFLPAPVRYLGSYFRKTSNPAAALVALAATSSLTIVMAMMVQNAVPGAFWHTLLLLLTTLASLAVIEHVALVVRVPDQVLWSWAIRSPCEQQETSTTQGSPSP